MTRLAAPLAPPQVPMRARARLDPNGGHRLDADLGLAGNLAIGIGDLPRLKRMIEAFETEAMIEDGHSNRVNACTKPLGEF